LVQSPLQPHYSLYVYLRTNTLKLMVLLRTSADGQPPPPDARTSHLRTLSKITGSGLSAFSHPPAPKCPREPHIIQAFRRPSIARDDVFSPRGQAGPSRVAQCRQPAAPQQGVSRRRPAGSARNCACPPAGPLRNRARTPAPDPRPPRRPPSPRAP